MEMSLHRQIKTLYGSTPGGQVEASVAGYRIDAIRSDGLLIEVQSAALSPLRPKIRRLVELGHRVRVVKPVVVSRRIVQVERRSGRILSSRMSPKRGQALEVFDDLVGVARWLAEPQVSMDVMEVMVEEQRVPRKRRPGFAVLDRVLSETGRLISIESPQDLWNLLPPCVLPELFTTRDLADALACPLHFAQRVAYCLRISGATEVRGKVRNFQCYAVQPRLEQAEPTKTATGAPARTRKRAG